MLVLGILSGILEGVIGFPPADHPAVLALINLIAFGLVLRSGLKRANTTLSEIGPLVPFRPSLLLPMAITVIGSSILISEINNVQRTVLPPPEWFTDYLKDLVSAETSLWGSIISLVVVAPLTEELLVRGLILRGFLSHYSPRKAILVSALFFGLLHLNPWQFIGATILGVLFAWWFIETRSMLSCFFGHAVANAFPLTLIAFFGLEIPGFTSEFDKIRFQPLWLDCVGVAFVVLGLSLLIYQFRKPGDTILHDAAIDESHQL